MPKKYDAYLASDYWRRRSRTLLAKRKFCQSCGKRACQVHHLTYERVGKERSEDLQALCGFCHETAHGMMHTPKLELGDEEVEEVE